MAISCFPITNERIPARNPRDNTDVKTTSLPVYSKLSTTEYIKVVTFD